MKHYSCERCGKKISALQFSLGIKLCKHCFEKAKEFTEKLKTVRDILSRDNM